MLEQLSQIFFETNTRTIFTLIVYESIFSPLLFNSQILDFIMYIIRYSSRCLLLSPIISEDESTIPVKGGQQSPFLNLLIQKPFISQSQHTIEVIVQLQKE